MRTRINEVGLFGKEQQRSAEEGKWGVNYLVNLTVCYDGVPPRLSDGVKINLQIKERLPQGAHSYLIAR